MNLLQQLSELKLTKEEIDAIIDILDHMINTYDDTINKLDKVIDLAKDIDDSTMIKIIINGEEDTDINAKSIEDVISFRAEMVEGNNGVMDNLKSAANKFKSSLQIFE